MNRLKARCDAHGLQTFISMEGLDWLVCSACFNEGVDIRSVILQEHIDSSPDGGDVMRWAWKATDHAHRCAD